MIGKKVKAFFIFRHGRFGDETDSSEVIGTVIWQSGDCISVSIEEVLWGTYKKRQASIYLSKSKVEILT